MQFAAGLVYSRCSLRSLYEPVSSRVGTVWQGHGEPSDFSLCVIIQKRSPVLLHVVFGLPTSRVPSGVHGGEQWKKKENNSDGHHGAKPERKHRTEAIGIVVCRHEWGRTID